MCKIRLKGYILTTCYPYSRVSGIPKSPEKGRVSFLEWPEGGAVSEHCSEPPDGTIFCSRQGGPWSQSTSEMERALRVVLPHSPETDPETDPETNEGVLLPCSRDRARA